MATMEPGFSAKEGRLLLAEAGRSGPEQFLEQGGGTVFVGVGQRRAARERFANVQL
jgi:hypothetical protein